VSLVGDVARLHAAFLLQMPALDRGADVPDIVRRLAIFAALADHGKQPTRRL